MIELRTLGSLDLRTPDGSSVGSVLAQPKRLALLVYLALGAPDGFVRRDSLLALFWPESDQERARAALRQAVRYLRRSLGEETIAGRADDELGIAPGVLRCDAVEMQRALAAGDHERALALYGGELLPGFHAEDAPGFVKWLDEQRAALRTSAFHAATILASRSEAAEDLPGALRWARQACELQPLDEEAIRRLLSLLVRTGDRSGAVAAFQDFERRLYDELELQPTAQTLEVVQRIREEDGSALGARTRPRTGDLDTKTALADTASRHATATERTVWRSRGRWLATGTAGALLLVVGLMYALPPRTGSRDLQIGRVLVAPFENQTLDATLDPVGRMAADWIIEGLSRTERFEVVPSTAVLASVRHAGEPLADAMDYRALAQETGASVVVAGSYYQEGRRLHFQAQLLDAASGRVLRPAGTVTAPLDSLVFGVDRLRTRVLAALAPLADTVYHIRLLAPPPTYDAYREYLLGMEAFVGGDPATALRHYERSAAADPEYPMPRLAAAIMYMNLGDFVAADSIAADVAPMRDRMGPLERSTLDFVLATLRGDWPAGYNAMVRAAAIAPATINEHMVGEIARRMNRPREALRVFAALGTERGELRGWRMYWREVAFAHHMLDDHRRELREARRGRALHPNDPFILSLEVQALAALGRVREVEARIEERLAIPSTSHPVAGVLMAQAANELAAHGHATAAARLRERGIAWFEALPDADRRRAENRNRYAIVLRHAGRFEEARRVLADLSREHPENLYYLGQLGIALAALGERSEAERISAILGRFAPPQGRAGPINRVWGDHAYARAAIAAQLGDLDGAVDFLRQAQASGLSFTPYIHADPALEPLRGHPAFREWLRPKG